MTIDRSEGIRLLDIATELENAIAEGQDAFKAKAGLTDSFVGITVKETLAGITHIVL